MTRETRWFPIRVRVCPHPRADSWRVYDFVVPAADEFEAISKAKALTVDPNVAWAHPLCPFRGFLTREEAERLLRSKPW
jgi:hypothetical protein